jgi:hypothetical protein
MKEPPKTGWRDRIRPFGLLMYAMASAVLTILAIWPLDIVVRLRSLLLTFTGLCIAYYFVWKWFFYERPAELEKKLPITSKELRRRKREFYDNLPR